MDNQKEERKQAARDLTEWRKQNLPEVVVGKNRTRRFEVFNPFIQFHIIVNKGFYEEIIDKYKSDPLYIAKLELAKQAHEFMRKATLLPDVEASRHHPNAEFLVFRYDYNGFELEFKVKKNNDGYFLHYMRILQ